VFLEFMPPWKQGVGRVGIIFGVKRNFRQAIWQVSLL
jgi:hypothetical protein